MPISQDILSVLRQKYGASPIARLKACMQSDSVLDKKFQRLASADKQNGNRDYN